MFYLLLSVIAYLLGPVAYQILKKSAKGLSILDGIVVIAIACFAIIHLTELATESNLLILILLLLFGLFLPSVFEKTFHQHSKIIHSGVIILGLLGFLLHVLIESAVIGMIKPDANLALVLGVIGHRVIVGLTIWSLILPKFGFLNAVLGITLLLICSAAGTYLGGELNFEHDILNYLQALLIGSILHVVIFNSHLDSHACCHKRHKHQHRTNQVSYEGIGNLIGLGIVVLFCFTHLGHDHNHSSNYLDTLVDLFMVTAPALFAAYVFSGILKAFFSFNSLKWINSGKTVTQASKGILFGLPIPICSCGVLPLYKTLTERGLAPAAALAILISTPELGLDAILISIPLLGAELTILRVIAAVVLAFVVSILLAKKINYIPKATDSKQELTESVPAKLKKGFSFSFGKLVDDTAPWIIIGIVLAAFFEIALANIDLAAFGGYDVVIAALIGIFIYVCASGATPMVAIMLAAGLSPGAAVAFLLSGPATNVSTFGILSNIHSRKFAISFGVVTFVTSILIGLVINVFFSNIDFNLYSPKLHEHHYSLITIFCAICVSILFLFSIVMNGVRNLFTN